MSEKKVLHLSSIIIAGLTCIGTELQGMAPAQGGKAAVSVLSEAEAFKQADELLDEASNWWLLKRRAFNALFRSAREGQVDKANEPVYAPQDEDVTMVSLAKLGYPINGIFTSENPPEVEKSIGSKLSGKVAAGLLNTFHLNDDSQPEIPTNPQVLSALMWPEKHRKLMPAPSFPPEFIDRHDRIAGCALSGPFARYIQRTNMCDLSEMTIPFGNLDDIFKIEFDELGRIPTKDHLMQLGGKAILRHNPQTKELETLAIQHADAGKASAWHYPKDEDWNKWQDVLMACMTTDTTVIRHLLNTHLIIAGTISALTNKHFKADHPLRRFLHPHTFGTLAINNYNVPILLGGENTMFPALFSHELDDTIAYMQKHTDTFQMSEMDIYEDVENRGMDMLPSGMTYPYADQGKRLWDIIKEYTTEYVFLHYKTDVDLINDHQVQEWYAALKTHIPNQQVEAYAPTLTTESLAKLMTVFIYTDSVEHYHAGVMTYNYLPW